MNSTTYAEKALLDLLPTLPLLAPDPGHAGQLVAGNRSGILPAVLMHRARTTPLCVHVFDHYHARVISAHLAQAGFDPQAAVRCQAGVGAEKPYARAFFQTTPRAMPSELVLDQLEDIHRALADGAPLYAAFEGDGDHALATVKKVFAQVHVLKRDKKVALFKCVRKGPREAYRNFAAEWTASVPGGDPLTFTSLPGCFCHRRADPGGLALAEVASRFLREAARRGEKAPRLMDMGCGCGLVGLLAADVWRRERGACCPLTLIDSHARAIEAARLNAARMGCEARFVLSDEGLPRDEVGTHDFFVGNPPYYSEYRIAEVFLSTAYRALRPGGVCLSVVKTATGLKALQEKYFRRVEVIARRGYAVLHAIR